MYICMCVCVCIYVYIYIYVCMYICMYVCVYVYMLRVFVKTSSIYVCVAIDQGDGLLMRAKITSRYACVLL
jgi:hypothetical protein